MIMYNPPVAERQKKNRHILWVIVIATLLLTAGILAILIMSENDRFEDYSHYQMLKRFSSHQEFKDYLKGTNPATYYDWRGGGDVMAMEQSPGLFGDSVPGKSVSPTDYSSTNVQVERFFACLRVGERFLATGRIVGPQVV